MILTVLNFLVQSKVKCCTMVVPKMESSSIWQPTLSMYSKHALCLGLRGQRDVVMLPSKRGFVPDRLGLSLPLIAHRLWFV